MTEAPKSRAAQSVEGQQEREEARGMTAERLTAAKVHENICGGDCAPNCYLFADLRDLAAAEYARGREECAVGHAADFEDGYGRARDAALAECAATHAALEAAAERRGEERVRRILMQHADKVTDPNLDRDPDTDRIVLGIEFTRRSSELWWALTGEGDPPDDAT